MEVMGCSVMQTPVGKPAQVRDFFLRKVKQNKNKENSITSQMFYMPRSNMRHRVTLETTHGQQSQEGLPLVPSLYTCMYIYILLYTDTGYKIQ